MKPAIRVDKISKQYRLGLTPNKDNNLSENLRLKVRHTWDKVHRLLHPHKEHHEDESFWALKDVSFEVQPGEVVGIIGRNGAGKSTLLKILSQIVEPTSGYAEVRGRMGSLLEVGTGFHPELTGRENIYLNGTILGMSKKEIDRKFDEIVAFSEIEKFLDTPVKRYSSGMYVRLAFAVAAHLEPEILVVDEVLAVGDQSFQQKCVQKMRSVGSHGRTVLFVSHNLPAIQNLCYRCVFMKEGRLVLDGLPTKIIEAFNREHGSSAGANVDLRVHQGRKPKSIPLMRRIEVVNHDDENQSAITMKGSVQIRVEFESERFLDDVTFGFVINDKYNAPVLGINNLVVPSPSLPAPLRSGTITCLLRELPLMHGVYTLDLYFGTRGHNLDVIYSAAELVVNPCDVFRSGRLPPPGTGNIFWPAEWIISAKK